MSSTIKPIQATPEIYGEDARRIMQEAMTPPSEEVIKELRERYELIKEIIKK